MTDLHCSVIAISLCKRGLLWDAVTALLGVVTKGTSDRASSTPISDLAMVPYLTKEHCHNQTLQPKDLEKAFHAFATSRLCRIDHLPPARLLLFQNSAPRPLTKTKNKSHTTQN